MKNSLENFVRGLRSVAWFFVGVLISALLIFPDAYAEDYPAYHGFRLSTYAGTNIVYGSGPSLCEMNSDPPYNTPGTLEMVSFSAGPPIQCILGVPPFTATGNYGGITYGYYCPAGGTLSGTTCVGASACAPGDVRNDLGVCEPFTCAVNESVGSQDWLRGFDTNLDDRVDSGIVDRSSTGLCVAGCVVKGSHLLSGADPATDCYARPGAPTKIYCSNNFEKTGSTCSSEPAPDVPSDTGPCPAGQSYGTVNGIPRCLAASDPPPPPPKKSTTNTGKVDNGDGTSTVTSTTTNNNSTSTTISIVDNSTGATISSTTTTASSEEPKTDQAKFCEDNPDSPMCKVSSISGSCSAVTCDGDAVQCAIAKEQQKRNCVLFDIETTLSTLGAAVAAGSDPLASSMPWHSSQVSTVDVAGGVTQGTWLSSSGISDKTFSLRGETITIPFSNLNSILSIMGSIIVAFSLLAAARIVGVIS